MALFSVKRHDTGETMIVRARCLSCARNVAANESKGDTIPWRDPSQSVVALIPHEGKTALIAKYTNEVNDE